MNDSDADPHGLTIYDVARHAGVSIASVSRVLNNRNNPRPETKERVLRAVQELGFVPDGAARALSNRFKEIVGVVFRRALTGATDGGLFEDENESLLFEDVINRGIEVAARHRGFDLLMSSVPVSDRYPQPRISALAGKCDGLILHDQVLTAAEIQQVALRTPVVILAGTAIERGVNVRSDNATGMRALAQHLVVDHGYRTVAYLAGHADSPDNLARAEAFERAVDEVGAACWTGPVWQGNYMAAGGAAAIRAVFDSGHPLPRAIACANDQTAIGVMRALAERGVRVPAEVAVAGFDDIPVARHLHPPLTTIRQPIHQLGATAFDVLYSLVNGEPMTEPEIVLPTTLVVRESCGCPPESPAARTGRKG
ncbi:MAG TPA: LacI family DNA-binding transcriptional regulator [Pseudonocardiaceae bacterium]|jgi:LacI family transcriptional regulator|nr:LacI family DNA-binding transcriptional regulator [Pseudonocardiaceae bacterium]